MISRIQTILKRARYAKAASGRNLARQLSDIIQIRKLPGRLSLSDYYDLRLYDSASFHTGTIEDYFGWRMNAVLDKAFNNDNWRALANDKILSYHHLANIGIPIPETVALFAADGRSLPGARCFRNAGEFIAYMREEADFPLFFKPNCGTFGRSSFAIQGYERDKDCWTLSNGDVLEKVQLERILSFKPYKGIFLQKILKSHAEITEVVGPSVACARMNVMRNNGAPFIYNAFWKIPSGHNMTDNFDGGKKGNLLGEIKIETGRIGKVISGISENYRVVDHHPDTGKILAGFQLPYFDAAKEMVCRGAISHEGLNFQHWDVVFTDDGPVAMEVNLEPDLHFIQLLNGRGMYDAVMKQQLAQIGALDQAHQEAVRMRAAHPELKL